MDEKMMEQITQLVQAAMSGDKQASAQVNKILAAAKKGDKNAVALAQTIQQVAQELEGKKPSMRNGAKINYLRSLLNICPEGQELAFFKAGGKVCSKCAAKRKAQANKKEKITKGGITPVINKFKAAYNK